MFFFSNRLSFNQQNFVVATFPHIHSVDLPPFPFLSQPPCNEYTLIHVAYLNGGRDTGEARGGVCVMKDCTGVENFVFAREGNFNFVSAWRQISIQERKGWRAGVATHTTETELLLIKNTKERRPMFKMREQRKYIYGIYETKERDSSKTELS